MAEDLERRPKHRKTYVTNQNQAAESQADDDLLGQTGRKKGRPPKDTGGGMNSGSLNPSPLAVQGSTSSSKTVAAILKQAKDQQGSKESAARMQQQPPAQKKKTKQMSESNQHSSNILNQLNLSKTGGSPLSRVASPSVVVSPAMSPSSIRGASPLGKEHNHPVTTKSSSLSRDLSPSRITAQMVKVMEDTTTTTSTPNLLRSALQGNMPDPMGILSSSKTEGGIVSVVTCAPGAASNFNITSRKPGTNMNSLSPSSNNVSGNQQHQTHTFSKILTSMAGSGGYIGQPGIDSKESKLGSSTMMSSSMSTVENLLASTDGTIQTVNVSHVPKSTNPSSTSVGTSSGSAPSSLSTSPRPSPRSAMEVAQQIKMEANGQKSSAQLAALRPGMQQQLRSQIQSSRSIDAQLAPKPTAVAFTKGQTASQRSSPKDAEQKSLETSMPLLAAKLAPSIVSSASTKVTSISTPSQLKHQVQQPQVESSMLLTSLSTLTPLSSSSSAASIPPAARKTPLTSPLKPSGDAKPRQQQPHIQRHLQVQQPGSNFAQVKQIQADVLKPSDQMWLLQQQQQFQSENQSTGINLSGGLGELLSDLDKQQALERLIQASIAGSMTERTVQTDTPLKIESHAQTVAKHLSSSHGFQRGNNTGVSQMPTAVQIPQDFNSQTTAIGGGVKTTHHGVTNSSLLTSQAAQALSKYRPGDSKQTAIDVDSDIGQLASITNDGAKLKTERATAGSSLSSTKDIRHGALHMALGHHVFNTSVPSISGSSQSVMVAKARDSQTFVPVQAVKSSSSFTLHSLQTTSSLAHIPKPIVHATSSPSSSLASVATSASLPPPPDYTPPPPYPVKLGQHYQPTQQQQQFSVTKQGQASKQSVQNPFTFPTSGVKVHTDHDSHGLLSYSLTNQANVINNSTEVKQETFSNFREPKLSQMPLAKAHSDISAMSGRQRGTTASFAGEMPRLSPAVSDLKVKVEAGSTNYEGHNHVGEMNSVEKRPLAQPFNQRISNLSCFPVMNSTYRAAYRSHAVAVQRARSGVITNTAKSLDILRQNLQNRINKELTDIIKKYTDKYFQPALTNIKDNNGEGYVGEEHINYVCRQILEEAKAEYICESERRSATPNDFPDNVSETGSLGRRSVRGSYNYLKRGRVSDSDSEKGSDGGFKRKTAKKKGRPTFSGSGRVTPSKTYKSGDPVKREGPKWDPERLKPETLFVMGARANKALGLGNTRGRLYIRHPDVFKYIGDPDDKLWLYEHNLMPATGGKAYMLLLEDIEDLSRSDDYRDSPGLMMHECVGFTVPEWMLSKMKEQMNALRSDANKRSLSRSPVSELSEAKLKILPFSAFTEGNIKEETLVSPADTEEMDFLSTADNDDTQPSSAISPFTVTGGFEDGVSPSPSDLDPIEDPPTVPSLFS